MPGRRQRPGARVVGQLGIDVQVDRAWVDELQVRQWWRALPGDPCVKRRPDRPVHALVFVPEHLPAGRVGSRVPGEGGRDAWILYLQRVAGHDPHERHPGGHQGREADHIVLDDDIRPGALDDLSQPRLAVLCAADELLPDRPYPRVQLLDRRLAELWRGVADEILPELPGTLASRRTGIRRCQVDKVLLKAKRLQPPLPGRLGREHDPVTAAAQNITDPDAVVGRPVRALGHEQDRQRPLAHSWLPTQRSNQITRIQPGHPSRRPAGTTAPAGDEHPSATSGHRGMAGRGGRQFGDIPHVQTLPNGGPARGCLRSAAGRPGRAGQHAGLPSRSGWDRFVRDVP